MHIKRRFPILAVPSSTNHRASPLVQRGTEISCDVPKTDASQRKYFKILEGYMGMVKRFYTEPEVRVIDRYSSNRRTSHKKKEESKKVTKLTKVTKFLDMRDMF